MSNKIYTQNYTPDLSQYDKFIVMFSGGKDSLACLLHLLDKGVDKGKIELWHQKIDAEDSQLQMDWPITHAYCEAIARAFDIPMYYQWRDKGFEGELLKCEDRTQAVSFECENGEVESRGGTNGKITSRLMWPAKAASLRTRWCSSVLKIDVASISLKQERFEGKRTLVLTGERAQESAARKKYPTFEPHRANAKKRIIDHWRPVHSWGESAIWSIIERWSINPHPAYRLGWGRVSCMFCIFGSQNQWASANKVNPIGCQTIARVEKEIGHTIDRDLPVMDIVSKGTPYQMKRKDIVAAMSREFNEPIFLDDWQLPLGAFGESEGPI